ncbi:Bug family tripartite tricarboxylate transporter substrate binding protein [Ramlibacter sp.]|uniref:Bug family tripartite tricarboxylate transporter substrate binding protein n=1 Tax=Ramlibacter sp. TaxID=1917967 RepID=UPI003D0AB2C4
MKTRSFSIAAATLLALAVPAAPSFAQPAYPSKPIRIIVAYPAGQGTDVATRYIAEQLGKGLGQAVVVENRPGAGGNLGTELAAQAAPDGYTLTMGTNATHNLNQFLYPSLKFNPEKDFEPVMLVGTFPMVIAASPKSKFSTLSDVMATVKTDPRSADVAMPSTTARLVIELIKSRSAVSLFGVPYRGSAAALTDVGGGQLPLMVDTPAGLRSHIAAGTVRPIAVTSLKASALLPGVAPVSEQGLPGFEVIAWNALYAPHGTPPAIVRTLNAELAKILAAPETQQRLLSLGFEPGGGSPADLAKFARSERAKWEPIIRGAGIKAE